MQRLLLIITYFSMYGAEQEEYLMFKHAICTTNDIKAVQTILNNDRKDINFKSPVMRRNALAMAISGNCYAIGELLIMRGIEINHRSNIGETALHEAMVYARPNFVELLLRHEADPSIQNRSGLSACAMPPGAFPLPATDERVVEINNLLAPYRERKDRTP